MNTNTVTASTMAPSPPWTMTVTRIVRPAAPPPISDADDRLLLALYFDRARDWPWNSWWPAASWSMQDLYTRIDHGLSTVDLLASLARLVAERRLYWHHNVGFIVPEDAPDWMMEATP